MKIYLFIIFLLVFSVPVFSQENRAPLLAEGNKVYIQRAEKDADVPMVKEIRDWGRWKIVGDENEADLVIRLRVSGSAVIGRVQAFILDAKTKIIIWTSKDRKGFRNVLHATDSTYKRAITDIVKQMKQEVPLLK